MDEELPPPFPTTVIRPTSAGQMPVYARREPAPSRRPSSGGKSKNEAVGGNGVLIFKDCDGAELERITWLRGLIQESGTLIVEVGSCEGGTGSTGGSTGP